MNKKYLKKIALFAVMLISLHTALLVYFYKYSTVKQFDNSYEVLLNRNENRNAKNLFIGNSRFMYGLDAKILKNSNFFNKRGATVNYYLPMLKYYLKHNKKPENLIISIGFGSTYAYENLCKNPKLYCSLLNIKSKEIGKFNAIKNYILGFVYPKILFQDNFLIKSTKNQKYFEDIEQRQVNFFKHTIEVQKQRSNGWYYKYGNIYRKTKTYDAKALASLSEINSFCKKNGIHLIIIKEPLHEYLLEIIKTNHPNWVDEENFLLQKLKSNNTNLKFYNFETIYSNNAGMFLDCNHLNKKGRTTFSLHLAKILSLN